MGILPTLDKEILYRSRRVKVHQSHLLTIKLFWMLILDEDITIDYSPLYADNILYSTELSRKGDCLEIRSDYLNAVVISYDRKELCDNVDAIQKEYCGSGDITILSDSKGVYIDNEASTASYDNCDSFAD